MAKDHWTFEKIISYRRQRPREIEDANWKKKTMYIDFLKIRKQNLALISWDIFLPKNDITSIKMRKVTIVKEIFKE